MPKLNVRPLRGAPRRGSLDLLGDLRRRLAPGQVLVDRLGRHVDAGLRRAAEIERRMRLLHRREQQPPVLDADVLAVEVDRLAGEQRAVDAEELVRDLVALVMRQEDAVALVLDRVAAGHDVDQQPALARAGRASPSCAPQRVGDCRPGRTATRKRSCSVSGASADATTQESSQLRPVGSSTP